MINKLMKGFKKNNKGFTLVELMVVVVIIGILVAIAIPVYNASEERARKGVCEANMRMIESALEQFYMNEGHYPGTDESLESYFKDGVPTCPEGNTAYTITGNSVSCTNHTEQNPTEETDPDA